MFFQYRADAPFEKAVLDLGDNFDTSAVENMDGMFWYTSHMFSAITLRLGKAFQFDNVKSSVLAFQLGESSNNKILVSKLEQKNFIIAPEHFFGTGIGSRRAVLHWHSSFCCFLVTICSQMYHDFTQLCSCYFDTVMLQFR